MERRKVKLQEHGKWIEREVSIPDRHPFDTSYEDRVSAYLNGTYGPGNWKPLFETEAAKAAHDAISTVRHNLAGFGLHAATGENLFAALNTRVKRKHHNKYPRS